MGRDKLAYFNQHVGGIAILSEPEISKRSLLRSTNVREWTAIHGVEVLLDVFLLAGNGSCGKVISYNEILVVLVCWVSANPSSTKQIFELCCHVTVVIVSQHGNEQTLSESARDGEKLVLCNAQAVEYSWSCPHNNIPCGESLQSSHTAYGTVISACEYVMVYLLFVANVRFFIYYYQIKSKDFV